MASAQWAVKLPTSNLVAAKRHLVTVTLPRVVWAGRSEKLGKVRSLSCIFRLHFPLDNIPNL